MVKACRAGNIYVNRGITGARVGIEPFGGLALSGTGPKTGGEDYVLAFLSRRSGFRPASGKALAPLRSGRSTKPSIHLRDWRTEPLAERLRRLSDATGYLEKSQPALIQAIASWKSLSGEKASRLVTRTLETVASVLASAPEISPQSTVEIPGQTNFVLWDTPRGVGITAVGQEPDPATLLGLIFGPLLAGNGLLVAAGPRSKPVVQVVLDALRSSGVPQDVLDLAPPDVSVAELAGDPVQFAAVDLSLEDTRALYQVLGRTQEQDGQQWLKALISVADGPLPGEPGFLRLFAHPKAVAIQTLRHGADLELL